MKKIIIIIMAAALILSACGKIKNDSTDVSHAAKTKEKTKQKDTAKNITENIKYYGTALEVNGSDMQVELFEEKDSKSKILRMLDDNDRVELLETLTYGWYKIRTQEGEEGYSRAIDIRAEGDIPPHQYDENSSEYVLKYYQDEQKVQIYHNGEIIKESKGSAGVRDMYTPKGIFRIEEGRRGEWSYIERFESGMKYWVGFHWIYLFHSVPMDIDKNIIEEEEKKLGEPASHGCIRLPVETAEYIYNNIPEGSIVLIY